MKEKKYIAPNEASLLRWIATLAVGMVFSILLSPLLVPVVRILKNGFMGISREQFLEVLAWVPLFFGLVFAIRVVGKTSLKDFVLGVGGKVNRKECLILLGLYVATFWLTELPNLEHIHLRDAEPGRFALLFLFMLLVLWTQTTWEELVFRGLLIRWVCKNQVGYTKKAVLAAVITGVAFALSHSGNVEVTSKSGIWVVVAMASYGVSGVMYFLVDLHFGSLLPGILIHWANNFMLTTLISGEVSSMAMPTLLVDATPVSGSGSALGMLVGKILLWLPIMVYMIVDARMKKRAAANCEDKSS